MLVTPSCAVTCQVFGLNHCGFDAVSGVDYWGHPWFQNHFGSWLDNLRKTQVSRSVKHQHRVIMIDNQSNVTVTVHSTQHLCIVPVSLGLALFRCWLPGSWSSRWRLKPAGWTAEGLLSDDARQEDFSRKNWKKLNDFIRTTMKCSGRDFFFTLRKGTKHGCGVDFSSW